MELMVSNKQAAVNRLEIQEMWKRIPPRWVDLDSFLVSPDHGSRAKIAKVCDGKDGPHNDCKAVGCFAGWNWTNHKYRSWCQRHSLHITSTNNLSVWLGLPAGDHPYFHSRQKIDITEKTEVNGRIKNLVKEAVVSVAQEVVTLKEAKF